MDYEEKKRRQLIRVVIAETCMVLAIIAVVFISVFAAMGFFISDSGTLEQSGLMQLHSLPTGATVELDGETLFARTNLSRTMSAGEHQLKLSRAGYDTWEKTITMSSGVLMRLYYPRLFLTNRTAETALDLPAELSVFLPSPDRNYILYIAKDSTIWHILDVRSDNLRELFAIDTAELITHPITTLQWNNDADKILVQTANQQWLLINLKDITKSINLSTSFGLEFTKINFIDGAATQLYALENHQLRFINTGDGSISKVLLSNISDYYNSGTNLLYLTDERIIGTYRLNEDGGVPLTAPISGTEPIYLALAHYYDDDYLCFTVGQTLTVYYGTIPHYQAITGDTETTLASPLTELKTLVEAQTLAQTPQRLALSPGGEYLVAQNNSLLMVTDLDNGALFEYTSTSTDLRWLDDSMLYAITNQELTTWDFDGTNRRTLATQVANYNVLISSDNRWLYYVVKNQAQPDTDQSTDQTAQQDVSQITQQPANQATSQTAPHFVLVREKIRE